VDVLLWSLHVGGVRAFKGKLETEKKGLRGKHKVGREKVMVRKLTLSGPNLDPLP